MWMKRSFLISISMALFLCCVASFASLAQQETPEGKASTQTDGILIDGAKATWEASVTLSEDLATNLDAVLPRLVVNQAATLWDAHIEGSQEMLMAAEKVAPRLLIEQAATTSILELSTAESLAKAASTTTPRILIEYTATTGLIQGLQGSSALLEVTSEASPKILIQHAETMQCYGLIPFHPSSPPNGKSFPVLWIVLGLLSAAAVIVLLTRSTW